MQHDPFNGGVVTRRSVKMYITDSADASMTMLQDPVSATMIGLTVAGGAMSAMGTLAGGNAAATMGGMQNTAQQFQATQDIENSASDIAQGQRAGMEVTTKANLLKSTAVANTAAGGIETNAGSAATNIAQITQRGKYGAAMDLFNGENASTADLNKAAASQYTGAMDIAGGNMQQQASEYAAAGSLMSAGGSAFKAYNSVGGAGGGLSSTNFGNGGSSFPMYN